MNKQLVTVGRKKHPFYGKKTVESGFAILITQVLYPKYKLYQKTPILSLILKVILKTLRSTSKPAV